MIIELPDLAASNRKNLIRVLHVDDDLCLLDVSKQILSMEHNFEIDNVTSVDEAFQKLENQQYDAVVSDFEMPQKSGLDFLRALREQNNQISFILFTGKGREDVAVKALNLGADSYLDKNGSPETVYCELAHAINKTVERKKSIQLLASSELKYRSLVENSLQGIMIAQGSPIQIVFANESMEHMLGYSHGDFLSFSPQQIADLIYHEDRAIFFGRFKNRLEGKHADSCYEFRAVQKDGLVIWMEAFATLIDIEGKPAVQAMFLDINERKKAIDALRKSEERYRALANFLPEIVFETDLSGKITFFSQNAFEITGFTPEELEMGMNVLSFVIPEDRERAKENIRKAISGEGREGHEYFLYKKDGSAYPALVKTAPIFIENKVAGLRGLVVDLTEHKKNEEALKKSEERFREFVLSSPDTMHLLYPKLHKIEFLNRKEFLGHSCKELEEANSIFPWLHLDDRELLQAYYQLVLKGTSEGERPVEYRLKSKTGDWEWVRSRAAILKCDKEGKPEQILVTLTVITESKKLNRS